MNEENPIMKYYRTHGTPAGLLGAALDLQRIEYIPNDYDLWEDLDHHIDVISGAAGQLALLEFRCGSMTREQFDQFSDARKEYEKESNRIKENNDND